MSKVILLMKMSNSNNENKKINIHNYLVSQAVDVEKIGQAKKSSDFDELIKAEEKLEKRSNITKNIKDSQVRRAVAALRLKNPFKGC